MQSSSTLDNASEPAPTEAVRPRSASPAPDLEEIAECPLQQAAFWLEFDEVTAELFTNLYTPHGYCARCGITVLELIDHLVLVGISVLAICLLATLQLSNRLLQCGRWIGKQIANWLFPT